MGNRISVLGISSGNGVLLHPFKGSVLGNSELRSDYYLNQRTPQWEANFPGTPMKKGLFEVKEKVHAIIGHPKCGLSSMLALSRGKSFKSHVGEPSLDLFMDSIDLHYPDFFFMENLPSFLDSYSLSDLQLEFPLYYVHVVQGPVTLWNNSQYSRVRLIIVGIKRSLKEKKNLIQKLSPPNYINATAHLKRTGQLLKNLPENGHYREDIDDVIAIYGGRQMSLRDIQEYWLDNPEAKRFAAGNHLNNAPGVYRNREQDLPSTVRKGNREFNPEGLPMSPRERARIQGIPDDFVIIGPDTHPGLSYKTMLNKGRVTVASTPPYEIGLWIKDILNFYYE